MCTAATYQTKDFYMGRTLDYEFSYGEEITITPRYYPFHFKHGAVLEDHYAMIGMPTWQRIILFIMKVPMKRDLLWRV